MRTADPTSLLYLGDDMESAHVFEIGGGTVAVQSRPHPLDQAPNQDAAAVLLLRDDRLLLAVADGVGGGRSGGEAAQLALEVFAATLGSATGTAKASVLDAIDAANREVSRMGVGAATTLAVAELAGRELRTYHVGDSRVLLIGQRGKRKYMTVDHSPVGYGVEAGLIPEEDAIDHEQLHLVSNVLGRPDMKIEVGPRMAIAARDTLAIASDGLFDNLRIEEIADRIRSGPLALSFERLMEDCRSRMIRPGRGDPSKPDDVTCLLFRPA